MSRQLSADYSRSARRAAATAVDSSQTLSQRRSLQTKLQTNPIRLGPYSRSSSHKSHTSSRSTPSVGGSPRPFFKSDEDTQSSDEDDLGQKHIPGIKLPVPTLAMSARKSPRNQNAKKAAKGTTLHKKERIRAERKAGVRKEKFEELDSDSDLTDVPSDDDDNQTQAGPSRSLSDKGKARSIDSLDSDSDTEMERKLAEAGDGESLLGSGLSGEDTEEEEERYIIQDATERESRSRSRLQPQHRNSSDRKRHGDERDWASKGDTQHRARSIAIRGSGEDHLNNDADDAEADVEDVDDDLDEELLSMSPDTLRMYGVPGIEDELFEQQEAFNSSSEPSFTDFFESSTDSDSGNLDGHRDDLDDDDEFTTDSDEDQDISDLEGGVLDAPLIAHIGTTQGSDTAAGEGADLDPSEIKPEMPLLVIEDLDGRLIYARAGDGEAVFGSDGEFEFVDDSDDDSADWEYDQRGNRLWNGAPGRNNFLRVPEDDGDTTDELPDEDMPYPRLLVGSVAPRGGRNARRARAMAAHSRRLSPASSSAMPSPSIIKDQALTSDLIPSGSASVGGSREGAISTGSGSSPNSSEEHNPSEVGITISTDDLARDPEGTLRAAAIALGVTIEEAASLVAGVQIPAAIKQANSNNDTNAGNHISSLGGLPPKTPEQRRNDNQAKPQMGSFMPTSAKSVHRAVIDGSRKAPSPFSGKRSLEKKGLAKKRSAARRSSLLEGLSSKRLRRLSSANDAASTLDDYSELAASSPEPEPAAEVDPMNLDDVVDADMLWRGSSSKSPSPELDGTQTDEEGQDGKKRASPRGAKRKSSASGAPGLNLNAFARWHKIPMGSFRDSQASPSQPQNAFQQQQPLGTFLLTRSHGSSGNKRTSSPFRSSSNAVRNPEMFSISPLRQHNEDSNADSAQAGTTGRKRSFIISPVLFPTRGGEIPPPSSSSSNVLPSLGQVTRLHLGASSSGAGDAGSVASGNSAGPGRITRREKREKRARRAAMLSAHSEAGEETASIAGNDARESSKSPLPTTPVLPKASLAMDPTVKDSDSPATAFPRMRITDATPTPRGSPAPAGPPTSGKDLLQPLSGLDPNSQSNFSQGSVASQSIVDEASQVYRQDPQQQLELPHQPSSPSRTDDLAMKNGVDSNLSNSLGVSGGLPSSACKTPLHSPLFGGIFGGALSYDLEEKEGEQLRI